MNRRTTLTPLLFPSPKHRRFVIQNERERHVGFGVPTHRRRVFIVASLHGDPRDVLLSQTARCAGECATTGGLCYACFHVEPEEGEPSAAAACVDFTEKRRPPLLHEIESLTPRNVRRLCVVREDKSEEGREAAGMLCANDVERLMGFPEEWTEPCARASRAHTPESEDEHANADSPESEGTPSERAPDEARARAERSPMDVEEKRAREGKEEGGVRTPAEAEGDRARRERSANESVARESSQHSEIEHDVETARVSAEPHDGTESSDDDLPITAQEANDIVRIVLMASATAVPQARWIGERLLDPYGAKFQRHGLGVPFAKEVVGGLDEPDGRAWADAGWNVTSGSPAAESWRGRHALRDCGDAPVNESFVPLGAFLKGHGPTPSADAAAAYVTQLQIAHTDIPGFVMDALDPYGEASAGDTAHWAGDKPHAAELIPLEDLADLASAEPSIVVPARAAAQPAEGETQGETTIPGAGVKEEEGASNETPAGAGEGSIGETADAAAEAAEKEEEALTPVEALAAELSGDEDEANHEDPFMVGTPVWAPWKQGKGTDQTLWPGISLDRKEHKEVIPDAALRMKQPKGATSETHKLVVFFGDRTYMWLPVSSFRDFEFRGEVFEKRMAQSVKRYSATFERACAEARVWGRTWRRLRAAEEKKKRKRRESAREKREAAAAATRAEAEEARRSAETTALATPALKEARAEGDASERTPGEGGAEDKTRRDDARDEAPDSSGSPGLFGVEDFGPDGYSGSMVSGAEPEPCGACRVCRARTPQAVLEQALAASKRTKDTKDGFTKPLVPRHLKCPQVSAVRAARKGHAGALVALRRDGAVGARVRVLWDDDDRFYRGTVMRFDPDAFTHDVEYDDGETSLGLRLWNESVRPVDAATDPYPNGRAALFGELTPRAETAEEKKAETAHATKKRKGAAKGAANADAAEHVSAQKKRKSVAHASDAQTLNDEGAQRCEACARAHKGISYCAARGHVANGAKRAGDGAGAGGKDGAKDPTLYRNDGAPRVAARRGGNGKFVVSESVGAVLLAAGLEVPERCQLCIRRKKGLAHCLKKQHIWLTPEQSAVLAKTPAAPKPGKAGKDAKAAQAQAAAAAAQAAAAPAVSLPALLQMPTPPGMSPADAAAAQAAAAAAMAAAMMGMGAMPVPMGMSMPRPPQ
jgi:site-specific DNA-cytosine methylase